MVLLRVLFICLFFAKYSVSEDYVNGFVHEPVTLWGPREPPVGRTLVVNAQEELDQGPTRHKRKVADLDPKSNVTVQRKINHLNDTHKQLMVHWVGEGSNVIICLARDPAPFSFQHMNPSSVYISYDYGDTYLNKTDKFKLSSGEYATVEKFYNHPKYNTHFVFTDINNKMLFTTSDHGANIQHVALNFTPHDVSFEEYNPQTILVYDKMHPKQRLWVSQDFGQSWRLMQEYVKSYFWLQDINSEQQLVVQRAEPTNLSIILYSSSLFNTRISHIYATDVKDFYMKGDYLFYTKKLNKTSYDLFVSYKLGKQLKCIFDTDLERRSYHIADVSGNRALIAVSHTDFLSHLYVSENLGGNEGKVRFTLSLKSILCYFPNSTWHDSWLHHLSEEAFADLYKVEGLSGIYIASQVTEKPEDSNLGPQHLVSRITFDHGGSWHPINVPERDIEGQRITCPISQNCSLHLSQRFSQLYPETRSVSILTSKSAPGIIVATGVLGRSLKGHFGVYISTDAGFTWRQALRDLYFFNMGDHGGILAAVKYYKMRGETRHVLFSTDEGENWMRTNFTNEDVRLYGLMTEPGENTTIFTMFGSAPSAHQWIIIKLDLKTIFKYNCTKDDFKTWSPSQDDDKRQYVPCMMGQQLTYQRRIPHANCYIGQNYDLPVSMQPCECDALDYECDFGFIRTGKPWHCIRNKTDSDPYKVPKSCQPGQFYNRTKGYRKIPGDVCVNGFSAHYMPDTIPCPYKETKTFLLFAQRERIQRFDLDTKQLETLPITDLRNVIAIDFDMNNNCVYWADIVTDTISRQCFDSGKGPEVLVSTDLSSIEGMALDWMSHCLYFVDGNRAKIELIKIDSDHPRRMRKTVLNETYLKKPRGIALHPKAGYLFWTDWGSEKPSVSRSNLDGSHVISLFEKPTVEWPNGITIDRIAERIYWVDARMDYIGSANLQGKLFKKIMHKSNYVSHPFAIAVFKDTMYWDDWKENSVFSADKDHGIAMSTLAKDLTGLMDLKVYAHSIQDGTNACTNSTCQYLCVGDPDKEFKCLCPDGMEVVNGKCKCPGNLEPFANMTCQQSGSSCGANYFTCGNSFCVPNGWRCDGEDDCGDKSDEVNCGNQTCSPNFFVCGDGKCIPQYWRCDHELDCTDKSDEANCPKQNCTGNQFHCSNGRCISKHWQCDGENDCRDGSDEVNCFSNEPESCKIDEFKCNGGIITCIPLNWRCDGEHDCADNSDEVNCKNSTCPNFQFACGAPSFRCIYSQWVCDGDNDCPDGLDEKNCTTTVPPTSIPNTTFPTANVKACHDWMFTCDNRNCIPYWWKCDNVDDCGDNSDEVGCGQSPTSATPTTTPSTVPLPVCKANQFQCSTGECIPEAWLCDNYRDCRKGEDEVNCSLAKNCTDEQFKCRYDGHCISIKDVCNNRTDCQDGSDESSCATDGVPIPATPSCSYGFFPCDDVVCFPLASLCDKKADCHDGFDEKNCDNHTRVYQVLQMGADEHGINESSLLLYWWIPIPEKDRLEFLPSISKMGENKWTNMTWIDYSEYRFNDLEPFTKYNMTVYVRVKGNKNAFPPAKYYVAMTGEGIPSEPWNITVQQRNGSHVLISWNSPDHPNGYIQNYEICWYPPLPPIKITLSDNGTSHLLAENFQYNVNYSFYVIAHNKMHESKPSEVKSIVFDEDVEPVKSLMVMNETDHSLMISWKYSKKFDGFTVMIETDDPLHPYKNNMNVKKTNISINNLPPSTTFIIKVVAFRKSFRGVETTINAHTKGEPLPNVKILSADILKEVAPTVKLVWEKPKTYGKVNWVYGVYYGINNEELLEKYRFNTTEQSAVIANLDACEKYYFSVGVIGPKGVGKLSMLKIVSTQFNKLAPPKRLTVDRDPLSDVKMLIQWSASCSYGNNSVEYEIFIEEKKTNVQQSFTTNKTKDLELSYSVDIMYGGIYQVKVRSNIQNAAYTKTITYRAPRLEAPVEIKVVTENGSFVVNWNKSANFRSIENYTYEVLVCEGGTLDVEKAAIYNVHSPPFVFKEADYNKIYTFGVRVKTHSSLTSEMAMSSSEITSTSNITAILITVFFIMAILVIALGFLYFRHRKLQTTFRRFTNSHYNTRAEAATFDDNGLDEDESPQILGFSDDEPLVIA